MLLRNFLTKFSPLLESLTSSANISKSYSIFINTRKMGCSTSKSVKIQSVSPGTIKSTMPPQNDEDFVEGIVCKDTDIKEDEMKLLNLNDAGQILLVRQKGKLSALGAKCPHYEAPLELSALGDGRIRCQWHGACFSLATGDIEEFPGLDSLPCHQVTVENNNVKVRARKSELANSRRSKPMTKFNDCHTMHFVIIGGGPSAAVCAETLRQEGFEGRITMIAKEKCLPYDRILINKVMDMRIADLQLRKQEFYDEHAIQVLTGCEAVQVNTNERSVKLQDEQIIFYDGLYIATGSSAKKANIPGADLKNVIVLRECDHGNYTHSQLDPSKHVVVLGSSFIGMEAAAYCADKVEKVTVVSRDAVPFQASFGVEVGKGVMTMFQGKNVNFVMQSGINRCVDNGQGAICNVELADGTPLKADILIMGTGSTLNTAFLKGSGVQVRSDGSVEVNVYLETNVKHVYAGGDIAYAPLWSHNYSKAAVGHYGLAQYHGRMAALNMLDRRVAIKTVPYFWSKLFNYGIRYVGHGRYNDIIYSGEPANLTYVAFYLKDDEVVSVSGCGTDPIVSQYAEYLSEGKKLYRNDIQGNPLGWLKH